MDACVLHAIGDLRHEDVPTPMPRAGEVLLRVGAWNSSYAPLPKNEWVTVLDAMATGQLDVKPLITHRVDLSQLNEHLCMMCDRSAFSNFQ